MTIQATTLDLTHLTLASSRVELALQRQKLAVAKIGFLFEIALMKSIHYTYMKDTFGSQKNPIL